MKKRKKDSQRCFVSNIKYPNKSLNIKIINNQMQHSNNIFNSAVYFQRRWYESITKLYDHVVNNIDEFYEQLTDHDCTVLFKYCKSNTNKLVYETCMKKLYQIYDKPKELLKLIDDDNIKLRLTEEKTSQICKKGRFHTTSELLDCVNSYTHIMTNVQFPDFLDQLKNVIITKNKNEIKTTEALEKNKEPDELDLTLPINLLPKSFLGHSFMDLYVKQNIPSYKHISSQVAQQIIMKVEKNYTGFFEAQKAGYNKARPPNYCEKDGRFNLIFQKNSFEIKDEKIRLSLGKIHKDEFDSKYGEFIKSTAKNHFREIKRNPNANNTQWCYCNMPTHEKNFIYIKFNEKILKKKEITEVELIPSQYKNRNIYKLVIKYKKQTPEYKPLDDNIKKASIDLGMVNLVTMFSPVLPQPLIYDGKCVINSNKLFNKKIDKIKSDVEKTYKKPTCGAIQDLLTKRLNVIEQYFHTITNNVMNYCKKYDIREIIIGYNINWKNRVKMGKTNNRTFYDIPYRKLINMFFYKGEDNNIKVVENEEAYTSKCDALGLEEVGFHEINEYMGKRSHRGLFESSKQVLLNADVNGAINIMRKYIYKMYHSLSSTLNTFIEQIDLKTVCNPLKVIDKLKVQLKWSPPGMHMG